MSKLTVSLMFAAVAGLILQPAAASAATSPEGHSIITQAMVGKDTANGGFAKV